jgi:hypothetical protein
MMTPQEALDKYGFVVAHCPYPLKIGSVEPVTNGLLIETGTAVKIVGEISEKEAFAIMKECGWDWWHLTGERFYKVVAE